MKSHNDKPGELGVKVLRKLAVQSLSKSLNPCWQAKSICAYILEVKSHIDKPGELGVEVSR